MTALTHLRTLLDGLYPGLWNASLGLLVVVLVWVMKKVWPAGFEKLPPALQALPAVFFSGLVSGLAALEPTLVAFLTSFIGGGLMGGAAAVGLHHMTKPAVLAMRPRPPASIKHITIVLALFFVACAAVQTAVQIAEDVWQVAKVLCLADQARARHARAFTVQDLCQTEKQLAPYLPAAQHPGLASKMVRNLDDEGDGGAP